MYVRTVYSNYTKHKYTVAREKHAITRRSQNLLDLHLHYVYVVTLTIFTLGLDQIKHVLLEAYYEKIGPRIAFQLWIVVFIFEHLSMIKLLLNTNTVIN